MSRCEHFGRWLKREIENVGETQAAFAQRASIGFGALKLWLAARSPKIRGRNVVKLARALGLSRDEVEQKLAEAAGTLPVAAA